MTNIQNNTFQDEEKIISLLEAELEKMRADKQQQEQTIQYLQMQYSAAMQELSSMQNSHSWKIMAPFRKISHFFYMLCEKSLFTHKARKAIIILFRNGPKAFSNAFQGYLNSRTFNEEVCLPQPTQTYENPEHAYCSEYQDNEKFSSCETDIKALAFYLPQYHTFPENDVWWGRGFTEWTNVRSGQPMFEGHYQPRVPHPDFGYYCLDDINMIRKQTELAKQHGIYGFCFYYYWFSGKRLMEKPVDMLLEHPEIDLPFCLCWANENWTRAWDGQNRDILIAQEYSDMDDQNFIPDLEKYLKDDRYIRIDGKPLILVYNPGQIPDCHKTFTAWRKSAKEIGIGSILIWTCNTANNTAETLNILDCIDGQVEFPPHNLWLESFAISGIDVHGKSAFIYHYGKLVDYMTTKLKDEKNNIIPVHHSVMLGWDNAARRKDGFFTYYGFSLKALYRWTLSVCERTRRDFKPEERFMFINAWNEWGEGTYLEPDEKYGYASINTVSKALFSLPFQIDRMIISKNHPTVNPDLQRLEAAPRIAVQIHMYYLETLDETIEELNMIPVPFDCYISTDTEEKKDIIQSRMSESCRADNVFVQTFENRGRDVAPFLVQISGVLDQYDYICHIHSKKTKTNDHGNEWRKYNFRHLFGCEENVRQILGLFENDPSIGLIMPETYSVLELQAEWGGNREGVQTLMEQMGFTSDLPCDPVFPVGNMFWAKTEAVRPLFSLNLSQHDFPEESGQVNLTLAHQIERCWVYLVRANGYRYLKTMNNCLSTANCEPLKRLCVFVHYNQENSVSPVDLKTLQNLSEFMTNVVFISNSPLSDKETDEIKALGKNISVRQRENSGMDFGAWRDVLLSLGWENIDSYDELVLCNNSFFPPVFRLEKMFAEMEAKKLDFWGNTVFPRLDDGSYIHRDYIPEHLQSYWLVFTRNATENAAFRRFWQDMPDYSEYIEVVANCESQLTELLAKEGLKYEPYIRETYYMSRFLNNYALPYEKPASLLLLGDPFIKKKCYQYMSEEEKVKLEYLWRNLEQNDCQCL